MVPLEIALAADDYLQNNNKKSNSQYYSLFVKNKLLKAGDIEYTWARILYLTRTKKGIHYDNYLESSIM